MSVNSFPKNFLSRRNNFVKSYASLCHRYENSTYMYRIQFPGVASVAFARAITTNLHSDPVSSSHDFARSKRFTAAQD